MSQPPQVTSCYGFCSQVHYGLLKIRKVVSVTSTDQNLYCRSLSFENVCLNCRIYTRRLEKYIANHLIY